VTCSRCPFSVIFYCALDLFRFREARYACTAKSEMFLQSTRVFSSEFFHSTKYCIRPLRLRCRNTRLTAYHSSVCLTSIGTSRFLFPLRLIRLYMAPDTIPRAAPVSANARPGTADKNAGTKFIGKSYLPAVIRDPGVWLPAYAGGLPDRQLRSWRADLQTRAEYPCLSQCAPSARQLPRSCDRPHLPHVPIVDCCCACCLGAPARVTTPDSTTIFDIKFRVHR
jgi:hypothetical protein